MPDKVIPPCYNYSYFHGTGAVVLNGELRVLLSQAIENSKNYEGNELLHNFVRTLAGYPSVDANYAYVVLNDKATFLVNPEAAGEISAAITNQVNEVRVHSSLWALRSELNQFVVPRRKAA